MDKEQNIALANQRIERAIDDINCANILYKNNELLGANNRAYYSIFHSMRAVLALERIDFKKHKDVQAYFNMNYVKKEIFPRKLGHKIVIASRIREDSDYDYNYVKSAEETLEQINTAEELLELVKKYLEEYCKGDKE